MRLDHLLRLMLVPFLIVYSTCLCAMPVITSVIPSFGSVASGNAVTINGSGFTGTTVVLFGSTPALSFTVNSDTIITAIAPAETPSVVNIMVMAPTGTSALTTADLYTFQGDWFAYVANIDSQNVTPIDLATNVAGSDIAVSSNPFNIAITPNGKIAYVTENLSNAVTPIDLATNMAGTPIPVGSSPAGIAITPNGLFAYVANTSDGSVTPINLITNMAGPAIPVGSSPVGIAITPNGLFAYVTNNAVNSVTPINLITNTPLTAIPVGSEPLGIAIAPNGLFAYVVNTGDNTITPINLTTNTAGASFMVGNSPFYIAISPNGFTAYVTNQADNTVTPINLMTNTVGTPISVGVSPEGIAITPDGLFAYVVNNGDNTVTPINLTTNTTLTAIPVGTSPVGIAITPDQAPLALFIASTGLASTPTAFDASGSTSPVGTIISYTWNFGDDSILTTASPIVFHTYAAGGTYLVSLTVTNSAGTSTTQVFTGQTMSRNGGSTAFSSQLIAIPFAQPIVFGINPHFGPTAGGTIVTISGSHFLGAVEVLFGSTPANFVLNSDNTITAIVPPGIGIVDVRVVTPGGTSVATANDLFTYISSPMPPLPIPPAPPSNFIAKVVRDRFATQTEIVHVLAFQPSLSPTVVGYLLFRNDHLIAKIPATGPFHFTDHNQRKHKRYVYTLVAVNANGQQSIPLTLTIR